MKAIHRLICGMSLLLAGPFGTAALAQAPTDPQAFAAQLLPQVRAAFPDAAITQEPGDPLQINIVRPDDDEPAVINLHRVFGFCQTAPADECTAERDRFVRVMAKAFETLEPEAGSLRIIVRDADYWGYVIGAKEGSVPLHRQIGDDLYAILAFDSPETIAIALPDMIAELGLSDENAWLFATRQTATIIPGPPEELAIAGSLFVFQGEEYAGSLMAYPERWEAIAAANGPDLAVIVNSDQFVIAGVIPDGPELERYRKLASEQCKMAARCISPNVYRWREGRWVIAR